MKKNLPVSVRTGLKRLGESLKNALGIGNYAAVIFALGLGTKWMNLADITEDPVGQALDEERLPSRVRETKI